jgi:4-amino-4-deoxy-L-arabinose transferase-like glycosyltransferase
MDLPPNKSSIRGWMPWICLFLILAFFASIRIRVADLPLERDEGEYAYAGQLILQGIPPYKLAYNMKMPGTYGAYAVIMALFGETPYGIHLGMVFVLGLTTVFIFLLGRKLFNTVAGLVAAASFGFLSTHHVLLALAGHANHFVVLFAVAGLFVLLKAQESKRPILFFASGLLLGGGFLMKQQGVFFLPFAVFSVLWSAWIERPIQWKQLIRSIVSLSLGCAIPFAVTCLLLWWLGLFEKFWFWTFQYAREYVATIPVSLAYLPLLSSGSRFFNATWPFVILAVMGLTLLLSIKKLRSRSVWMVVLLIFSFLSVSVGFYYRLHYFLLILPALCLFVGALIGLVGTVFPGTSWIQGSALCFFALCFGYSVYLNRGPFFMNSPQELELLTYSGNPFHKMEAVAEYIRKNTTKDARIAVMGSEPEIYFLADRHSATGYIYTYGLMELQPFALKMQKEMAQEIEAARPEYIVLVKFRFSWLPRAESENFIFTWLRSYTAASYEKAGLFDFLDGDHVQEYWGPQAAIEPQGENYITLFRRKDLPAQP